MYSEKVHTCIIWLFYYFMSTYFMFLFQSDVAYKVWISDLCLWTIGLKLGSFLETESKYLGLAVHICVPGGSVVKNPPTTKETQLWSLHWEDPLEEEMATDSRILAWKISWTEEPDRLQCMRSQRVGHDWAAQQQRQKSYVASAAITQFCYNRRCHANEWA